MVKDQHLILVVAVVAVAAQERGKAQAHEQGQDYKNFSAAVPLVRIAGNV